MTLVREAVIFRVSEGGIMTGNQVNLCQGQGGQPSQQVLLAGGNLNLGTTLNQGLGEGGGGPHPLSHRLQRVLLDFQLFLLPEPDHLSLAQQVVLPLFKGGLNLGKGGLNLLGGLVKGQIHLANQILVFSDGLFQGGFSFLDLEIEKDVNTLLKKKKKKN